MKICMYNVTTAVKLGGIETYYWEMSKCLKQMGNDIEIITGNGKYIKYHDIKLKQFPFTPRDKMPNLGNRFKKFLERVSFYKNARTYIKSQKYEFFLVHKPFDFFVCFLLKLQNKKIKTVFISGGEDFYGFDKFFSKYVDFMFAVSKDNAIKIEKRYKKKVKIIPNGVDVEKFYPLKDEQLKKEYHLENKKVLISVGRVVALKGFQLVLQALKELEDFYYVIIGDGEYLDTLKQKTKEYKIENRVIFLGQIENQDLPKYLNIANVFIQPTIGNEAFGITIVEALACGLPVVASRNGGIVDIITHEENGYLFEINNVKEMIQKIQIAYKNKKQLSEKSISLVKNHFTWQSSANKLLKNIGIT